MGLVDHGCDGGVVAPHFVRSAGPDRLTGTSRGRLPWRDGAHGTRRSITRDGRTPARPPPRPAAAPCGRRQRARSAAGKRAGDAVGQVVEAGVHPAERDDRRRCRDSREGAPHVPWPSASRPRGGRCPRTARRPTPHALTGSSRWRSSCRRSGHRWAVAADDQRRDQVQQLLATDCEGEEHGRGDVGADPPGDHDGDEQDDGHRDRLRQPRSRFGQGIQRIGPTLDEPLRDVEVPPGDPPVLERARRAATRRRSRRRATPPSTPPAAATHGRPA